MSRSPDKQAALTEQYHDSLNAWAPPGKLIPQNPDSQFQRVLGAWAEDFALLHQYAEDVACDWIPVNTIDRLSEWEQSCGLPDCDAHRISTTEGRRAAVVGHLSQTAGQSGRKERLQCSPQGTWNNWRPMPGLKSVFG